MLSESSKGDKSEERVRDKKDGQLNRSIAARARIKSLAILHLGIHAHEPQAPDAILNFMKATPHIAVLSIIDVLAHAAEKDLSVESVHLCDPRVSFITKDAGEGSFCGYRNLQMMISYLLSRDVVDEKIVLGGIPSISAIQDLIEDAWDRGINANGRTETGGVRGTRKHIGTPEAQALFSGLGIKCQVMRFDESSCQTPSSAKVVGHYYRVFEALLGYVERHFQCRDIGSQTGKMRITNVSPIYLQRPRHSMTIVGIERRKGGKRNLLVLDPAWLPSKEVLKQANILRDEDPMTTTITLKPFRRGRRDLGLYREFETLVLPNTT